MSAISNRLNRAGKEILGAAELAFEQATVLEHKWDVRTAEEARRNLCGMLKRLHTDNRFWSDLAKPVKRSLDPGIVERLMHTDLDNFEEFEIRTFRAAGLDSDLARRWAREASLLLFVVRLGFDGNLPTHLQPDIAKARASVKVAHHKLCEENPRLTDPTKSASGKKGWKKFWGALDVVGGLGFMGTNGALLVAGVASGGLTAVLGGGTVLAGFWRTLDGARRLQEMDDGS